jgi:poly(glycerol-phosphate) alpha-glucosyltransferase
LVKPIFDKEKVTYLKNADVFILPSFEEGDSIALKEAISIGIPVIISKQCRMDIVKEYNAGFVTDTKSSEVLASLLKLEKSDLQEMGNNARILAETYYNNDDCTNRLIHIYEDLFTGNRTSPDWINVENASS